MNKNIIKLKEDVSEYEIEDVNKLDFDIFIYSYESGSYEGNGFAAWKKGDDWYYHELGHCSCNGPLDGIEMSENSKVTLEQLEEIANKSYQDYGKEVIKYIKENV